MILAAVQSGSDWWARGFALAGLALALGQAVIAYVNHRRGGPRLRAHVERSDLVEFGRSDWELAVVIVTAANRGNVALHITSVYFELPRSLTMPKSWRRPGGLVATSIFEGNAGPRLPVKVEPHDEERWIVESARFAREVGGQEMEKLRRGRALKLRARVASPTYRRAKRTNRVKLLPSDLD